MSFLGILIQHWSTPTTMIQRGKVASRSVNKWDPEVETEEEFRNREGKRHHDGAFYPEPPKFLWGLLG
ncbi:unnamed protein product [Medioppia subpectinata]|uniref:Uncharacterized protein n=1 Tax=Medioppia subpectinata TaxID=1979941 RepID=A0A7R9KF83_9ACAR|nr:unnamed protein product [Medioppia subpectinata]CAG2101255.1 unnamed protein product [Medioppia subpectinata]